MAERRFELVSDVLSRVVRGLDIETELRSHSVEPAWPRAVGPRVAFGTRPASLRGGVLVVEARSAAWMNEASLLRETIRSALNRELGGEFVRELRFRLAGGFPPLDGRPEEPALGPSEEEVRSELERLAPAGRDGAAIVARARALERKARAKSGG